MSVLMKRSFYSLLTYLLFSPLFVDSQVNAVEFGKNRIQYKKFGWHYYQSDNFNVYYNEGGLELAKYILQLAEAELNGIEDAVEYPLSRRADIIIYNHYDDYKSSNIGLGIDWQNAGGLTRLVNNKMALYFDGNHQTLRLRIRQGIVRVLMENILFGDDVGEFASNQALLDLPTWLTDGYVAYIAEGWTTEKDNELKNVLLSGEYQKFNQIAFDKPLLAGQAFWHYISRKYQEKNVTYFLYLARIYKNLNSAAERICKKKFNEVLNEFMQVEGERYMEDIRQRKNAPKGKLSVIEEVGKSDFYHFAANPNPKNNAYAVVQFTQGKYRVKLIDNLYDEFTLLEYGVKTIRGDMNPNMPILAWDGKGTRLLCIYTKEGKTFMFVYDMVAKIKRFKQEVVGFDQVLDAGYFTDANTLLMSAVKNGHTDIFTYRIDNQKITAITNDVYDDLDPSFVTFPGRYGIIFSSNRPSPNAPDGDTILPGRNTFNIFLADYNNENFRQISQLTRMKYGQARYPMQYSVNHFTFVSDENGISNRWAGFFTSETAGLDTVYFIGEDVLRNPVQSELDSTLSAWLKDKPDSMGVYKTYEDSTYAFPITNYQSSLLETRVAGNNDQVSEVRQEGDLLFLYKLRIDSSVLRKRNVNARPTDFIRNKIVNEKLSGGQVVQPLPVIDPPKQDDFFQNEFEGDTNNITLPQKISERQAPLGNLYNADNPLARAGLHPYGYKFDADYVLAGVSNNIIINRYQPYQGGVLPVILNNGNQLNGTLRVGVSDVMEDIRFIGGFRSGFNLTDKDVFFTFQNNRRFIDWGLTYFRSNVSNYFGFFKFSDQRSLYNNMLITSLYQFNVNYPFDEVKSLRLTGGLRVDRGIVRPFNNAVFLPDTTGLLLKDSVAATAIGRVEFVYDNSLLKTDNIWQGLRYKIYTEMYLPTDKGSSIRGRKIFNTGFDARYYYPIYKNFTWCLRAAGDISYGDAYMMYYLGGVDGWLDAKASNEPQPPTNRDFAFQTLAVNMRGYKQNLANGNNAIVINSEFRLPVFTTFINKPINNAFLRNFQLVQFIDFGTAWSGGLNKMSRPTVFYLPFELVDGFPRPDTDNPTVIKIKSGGIGPFAGGYGFGARSTLLGYFIKVDAGWPMNGLFLGKPVWYFAIGFDF
jgi:hypothetical protein